MAPTKIERHELAAGTPGTAHHLLSLHFGTPGSARKAYLQCSLHADELPGMLVGWHLRRALATLQAEGRLRGEIVLVPAANPLGLAQFPLQVHQGRFDATSGENFNRGYADLAAAAAAVLGERGATAEVPEIRAALRTAAAALPAPGALASLRRTLLTLAIDAELVLDLHCDGEAVLHGYTTPACWPEAELLSRCMGWRAALLADRSGGEPFDEACSSVWPLLGERLGRTLPQGCTSVTVELRGEADVDHALAAADAEGIIHFLQLRGFVEGPAPAVPAALCQATPLAASMPMPAPCGGLVVFNKAPGSLVQQGELVAEVIDPLSAAATPVTAPTSGLFYARCVRRFTAAGMSLGKVAGTEARRSGALLSP